MSKVPDRPLLQFTELSQDFPPDRPTSVTVFGILHLLIGGCGLCGTAMTGRALFLPNSSEMAGTNPTLALMDHSALFCFFMIISISLRFVATVVLMISGIGLLKLRPYGRQLAIAFGAYSIVMNILGFLVNVFMLYPWLKEQVGAQLGGVTMEDANRTLVMIVALHGIGLIYPGLLLFFMFRQNVTQAFRFEFTENARL